MKQLTNAGFLPVTPCFIVIRFYKTDIVEDSNVKRYALTSWEGASPDVRKAYGAGDSFDDYYNKMPKKIPNLRYRLKSFSGKSY